MSKKKDVLFLCQFFYPEFISSATLPFDTAKALKEAGFQVDALCGYPLEYSDGADIPVKETVEGIDIHRVRYIQLSRKSFLGRLINYFSLTFMMLLRFFKMARYKSVVVYSNPPILPWVASWAKALFGTKLIFVAYDLYPEIATRTGALRPGSMITRLMEHINKCVYRRADRVVVLSEQMKEFVLANRPISPDRVAVIPNWYADEGAVTGTRENNEFYPVTGDRFVVSYFGNMGTAQDMDTILHAMKCLKDDDSVCFLFAGHGNKVDGLKEAVSREQMKNVHFFDFLRGQHFQDALAISDCALVSLAEGLVGLCAPSKTYSYMMQGIPLLAIMDRSDIVRDIEAGAGAWVRNGEGEALARAIKQMQADPQAHAKMRQVCRGIFLEQYTTEISTGKYVKLVAEIL